MDFLTTSYPYYHKGKDLLKIAGLLLVVGFIFEYFWVPFERNESEHLYSYLIITIFHIGVAVVVYIVYFLIFSFWVEEEDWKVYKELLSVFGMLTFIGVGEWIIRPIIYSNKALTIEYLITEVWHAYLAGGLIYLFVVYINKNMLTKQHGNQLTQFRLDKYAKKEKGPVKIKTQNISDDFTLDPTTLICARADGNYLELYLENEVSPLIKRITLQSLAQQLKQSLDIIKTHRAYLVNVRFLEEASGNAQGYQLKLKGVGFDVPVSRKHLQQFNERMT